MRRSLSTRLFLAALAALWTLGLLVGPPLAGQERSPKGAFWLRVYSSSRLPEARRILELTEPTRPEGGRARQVFLRRGAGAQGFTLYEVITGPYESSIEAVLHGLRLRAEHRYAEAGARLDALAVLLPTSFVPLPLRFDDRAIERLNPGRKRPYPELGELLVARAMAFSRPRPELPAVEHVTARFDPFTPLLVLGETDACCEVSRRCLRWFEVLHTTLIRTAWIPAHLVVRQRDLSTMELAEGTGRTKARGGMWRIGRCAAGDHYALVFRRGSLPPQRLTVTLPARMAPPFRLAVDKHGPGIYNSEGKVVHRPTLGPWTYQRPPLWQIPSHLTGQPR